MAWQERGGGVFEGSWYPNAHYEWNIKKIRNLLILENTSNQPLKFRNKIKDDAQGMYNANSQVKFKVKMLKSNLCD